jgi:hypothetical protein
LLINDPRLDDWRVGLGLHVNLRLGLIGRKQLQVFSLAPLRRGRRVGRDFHKPGQIGWLRRTDTNRRPMNHASEFL